MHIFFTGGTFSRGLSHCFSSRWFLSRHLVRPQFRNRQKGYSIEVCVSTHIALRVFITIMPASQLHFLADKNAELAGGSQ